MNVFGIDISFSRNGSSFVKRKECHEAHQRLEVFIDSRFVGLGKRIDDLKDSIENYLNLLRK